LNLRATEHPTFPTQWLDGYRALSGEPKLSCHRRSRAALASQELDVVNGARQAADAALVTGSAEMKWLCGWSTAATFEGEFSNVTRSYAGKGVVRYAW
jgi:hypothetical protein